MKCTLTTLVIGLSLLTGATTSAWAQDFRKGFEAYKQKDYAAAMREWRPLAEQGDADAQLMLGRLYEWGRGVVKNKNEAIKWYRLAAEGGDWRGQDWMANAYFIGVGVPIDEKEAVKWWHLAAEQGSGGAQYQLGLSYSLGQGVVQDKVKGLMWLDVAILNGFEKVASDERGNFARGMTRSQIAEAQKLARECVAKNYKGC